MTDQGDQRPFAPPSNPGFRDPSSPPVGANGSVPPGAAPNASWPSAGTVPFTPHSGARSGRSVAALVIAIVGAVLGLAIGWGLPLSVVALVLVLSSSGGARASRRVRTWTIVLCAVSAAASAAWLAYSIVTLLGR